MSTEKYELEIGSEGLDYDILDASFNPSTKAFILNAGIQPGMKVLDVGCGAGVMTTWLAKQVGANGHVTAIDNSDIQLAFAQKRLEREQLTNVDTRVLSVYDISELKQHFDLIYCRFVLHHVHKPRHTLQLFYENLNANGIYIGEEGIISAAFAYPPSFSWQGYQADLKQPNEEQDGLDRDGDFGIKLFYYTQKAGFEIEDCKIVQPVLWNKEQKKGLISGLEAYKKTDLSHGTTELEWQRKYDETVRMINDDSQMVAFYGSCQVAGRKR